MATVTGYKSMYVSKKQLPTSEIYVNGRMCNGGNDDKRRLPEKGYHGSMITNDVWVVI